MITQQSKAKQVSIMAITAALYSIIFIASFAALPLLNNFALLYLPIILLGVFPMWFGWSGLVGSMIGGFVGGALAEGLGFLAIFESVVALIIFMINWVLIPKNAIEDGSMKRLAATLGIYTLSLFVGTCYIVWQYTLLPPIFVPEAFWSIVLPTFGLNLPIVLIASPALIKAISPRLRTWGLYTGNFKEWLNRNKKP